MKNIIVGTAGHIDHGKTTLIRALTGRNTDRWEEEQRRGITIDLGFTWFDLPSGNRVGIIDVPGHEKFVNNMVAGAVLGYYLQKINDLLRRCGAFPIALLGRGFELCQYRLGIDLLGLRLSGGRGFFGRGSGGCTGCQAKGHDQYKNERQDFFHSFVFLSFVVFL